MISVVVVVLSWLVSVSRFLCRMVVCSVVSMFWLEWLVCSSVICGLVVWISSGLKVIISVGCLVFGSLLLVSILWMFLIISGVIDLFSKFLLVLIMVVVLLILLS